ncbi:hypothetical protein ACE6H2_026907 [Prunus campanulata]
MWFTLEEEEEKDGNPIFPKLPRKRDNLQNWEYPCLYRQKNPLGQTDTWQLGEKSE